MLHGDLRWQPRGGREFDFTVTSKVKLAEKLARIKGVFKWVHDVLGKFKKSLAQRKAARLYNRGMQRAADRDPDGAIDDYTQVIDMSDAANDMKLMARLNRGFALYLKRDYEQARRDLSAVLEDRAASQKIKEAASQKLKHIDRRASDGDDSAS